MRICPKGWVNMAYKIRQCVALVIFLFMGVLLFLTFVSCSVDNAGPMQHNLADKDSVSLSENCDEGILEHMLMNDPKSSDKIGLHMEAIHGLTVIDCESLLYAAYSVKNDTAVCTYFYDEDSTITISDVQKLTQLNQDDLQRIEDVRREIAQEFGKAYDEVSIGYIFRDVNESVIGCIKYESGVEPIVSDDIDILE